jgi:regulator of nucleoside diphosphate kinase
MDRKPKITISERDLDRIEALLDQQPASESARYAPLRAELARASLVERAQLPKNTVAMNSTVTFADEETGHESRLTLVYPQGASAPSTVSILAPVGSALLGLKVGQHIAWPMPDGHSRLLKVLKVDYQAEPAGDYHR